MRVVCAARLTLVGDCGWIYLWSNYDKRPVERPSQWHFLKGMLWVEITIRDLRTARSLPRNSWDYICKHVAVISCAS